MVGAALISLFLENNRVRRALFPPFLRKLMVRTSTSAEEQANQLAPSEALYGSVLNTFNNNDPYHHAHVNGRVFLIAYSFMLLILVSCYTGAVANLLAQNHISLVMPKVPFSQSKAHEYLAAGVRAAPHSSLAIVKGASSCIFVCKLWVCRCQPMFLTLCPSSSSSSRSRFYKSALQSEG
jgi:hypothetical protein